MTTRSLPGLQNTALNPCLNRGQGHAQQQGGLAGSAKSFFYAIRRHDVNTKLGRSILHHYLLVKNSIYQYFTICEIVR